MLTAKNKALLKKLANPLEPSLVVGKGEIDASLLQSVSLALKAHELIKVKVLTNQKKTRAEVGAEIASKTASEVVQIVGRIVVLYKKNEEKPLIVLG